MEHLDEIFGPGYVDMDHADKHIYLCALAYAITEMAGGESPDDAWEGAMDVYGDAMFDEQVFDDLTERSLRIMIFSQFECVSSQLRNIEREIAQAEQAA